MLASHFAQHPCFYHTQTGSDHVIHHSRMKKGTGQQTLWQQWVQVGFIWSHCPTPTGAYNTIVLTRGKTIAHPYLMSEIQTLYAALNGKLRLLWSCYDGLPTCAIYLFPLDQGATKGNAIFSPATKLQHLASSMGIKITFLSRSQCLQFPWDPGGSIILHRLGASRSLRRGNVRDYPWLGLHMGHVHGPRAIAYGPLEVTYKRA